MIEINFFNGLANEEDWSVVAQYGVMPIALFQQGLTTAVFREFGKVPERSEAFTTSTRSASKQFNTLLLSFSKVFCACHSSSWLSLEQNHQWHFWVNGIKEKINRVADMLGVKDTAFRNSTLLFSFKTLKWMNVKFPWNKNNWTCWIIILKMMIMSSKLDSKSWEY